MASNSLETHYHQYLISNISSDTKQAVVVLLCNRNELKQGVALHPLAKRSNETNLSFSALHQFKAERTLDWFYCAALHKA